jgi:hypothetical protein
MGISPFAEARDLPALILFLGDFSALEHKSGNRQKAARLAGAVQAIRERIGLNLFDTVYWDQPHKEVRGLFDDVKPSEEEDFRRGHSTTQDEAVAYALSEGTE